MSDGIIGQQANVGRAQAVQDELRRLTESIQLIDQPIDHGSSLEQHAGMIGYAINTVKTVGEISGSVYDAATKTSTFSTAYSVASGVGNSIAGNHEEAGKLYTDGLARATNSPLVAAGADSKKLIEDLWAGEWASAAGDLASVAKDVAEVVVQPVHKIIEVISAVASAEGNRQQFISGWQDDANHAAVIATAEHVRDTAVERLTKLYWEKVEEARALGLEPTIASWVKPADYWDEKRVSADLGDSDSTPAQDAPPMPSRSNLNVENETQLGREHAPESLRADSSFDLNASSSQTTNSEQAIDINGEVTLESIGDLPEAGETYNLFGRPAMAEASTANSDVTLAEGEDFESVSENDAEVTEGYLADSEGAILANSDATTAETDVSETSDQEVEGSWESDLESDHSEDVLARIIGDDGEPSIMEAAYEDGQDGLDMPAAEYETAEILGTDTTVGSSSSTDESQSADASGSETLGDGDQTGSGDWSIGGNSSSSPDSASAADTDSSTPSTGGDWGVGGGSGSDNGGASYESGGSSDSSLSGSDSSVGGDSDVSSSDSSSSSSSSGVSGDSGGVDSGGGDSGVGTAV